MPGGASNILSRLAQSGCCPGARAVGGAEGMLTTRGVICSNGRRYALENYQGGIRARALTPVEADCDLIEEGGILTLR
jgi:hypothetical protein